MKALLQSTALLFFTGLAFWSCSPDQYAQTGEYDDLYFNASDRQQLAVSQPVQSNRYEVEEESFSSKTTNPEYVARYRTVSEDKPAEKEYASNEYFVEDYEQDEPRYSDTRIYNYYGRGYSSYDRYYDPFYSPYRYASSFYDPFHYGSFGYYDPFYRPHFRSGFNISFGFGFGSRYYDPFYYGAGFGHHDPFYRSGFYNGYRRGFYDGFYSPYGYSRFGGYPYYSNVILVSNENPVFNNRRLISGVRSSRASNIGVSNNSTRSRVRAADNDDARNVRSVANRTSRSRTLGDTYSRNREDYSDGIRSRANTSTIRQRSVTRPADSRVNSREIQQTRQRSGDTYNRSRTNERRSIDTNQRQRSDNNRTYQRSRSQDNSRYQRSRDNSSNQRSRSNNSYQRSNQSNSTYSAPSRSRSSYSIDNSSSRTRSSATRSSSGRSRR